MEKKIYGMNPSYRYMKEYLKRHSWTAFYYHGINLVYYCIKHDFTEEQVIEYLNKEVSKCEKYLKNHDSGIRFDDEYEYLKDIINVDMNVFKLKQTISYKSDYDFDKHEWITDRSKKYTRYWYITGYSKIFPEKMFRSYNDHSIYLYDRCTTRNGKNYRGLIEFGKTYDENGTNDIVRVHLRDQIYGGNLTRVKKEFIDSCMLLWHFVKLFDYVEEPNNIDVKNEVYKRLEISEIQDNTDKFKLYDVKDKEPGFIKQILTKIFGK